jgi:hypothetical protein
MMRNLAEVEPWRASAVIRRMDDNHQAPQGRTPGGLRLLGIIAIAALVIAIILLALGVFDFEQRGWFN